jgi:hypothetical protein
MKKRCWWFVRDWSCCSSCLLFRKRCCFGISSSLWFLQFGISFCNLVFLFCLCNCFGISSSLRFLQFGISFCNLVFLFCLCNYFGISSSLQFLQFGIWVKFLQKKKKKKLEWYFVFRFCKIWYFDFPSASVMAFTTKEIVWLRWLLADMRVFFSHPTPMNCDNQSSIQIAHNSVFMSELSTLRSIVILLVIISSMTPLLCLLFILPCRLQIAFHISFSFSSWQTLDACRCRIVSLRGDVK